jgi:1,4-dihydroxy-2-naphthoyl-CoA hydrolase
MAIWKKKMTLAEAGQFSSNTMIEHLGIQITEVGDDYLKGSMPVDHRTKQPMGLLHGGASVALAETLGSYAAYMTLDAGHVCVGMEINSNHIRSVRAGLVYGVAKPVHIGRSTQIWDIRISDEFDETINVSRLTLAVLKDQGQTAVNYS